MEWTNDIIFEFLTLYENEPALWNSSSPQHKNKNDVHDAWLRIKTNLKGGTIPIKELKKKKENLMSTYRKLKAKIKDSTKTGSGADDIYKPEWPFYDIMAKFLDDVYKPKITKTSIMISDESEDYSKDECNESIQNLESTEEQVIAFKTPKIIPKKKRKVDETQNRMDEAYTYLKQLGQMPRKDVSSLYCDLLAEKLRGLQDDTREVAMLEIDNLVFNLKRREKEQQFHQPSYYTGATAIRPLRPLSPYHSPQDSPSSSSQSPVYQSPNPHTPSQAPYVYTQIIPNPQQSPSIQSPQGSPSFSSPFHSQQSSSSQSPTYQSPNPHTPSQAPYTQTIPNPQQSPSIQSPQGSPSFPPPFHSQPSSSSQSPVYQSPNPHTPSQTPYVYTQTIPNPQQSPSIQSPQGSPSFPPPFHSQPSSSSQSPVYQSPNPHTPSQTPYVYTQTIPNPQQSPSVQSPQGSPSFPPPFHSQPSSSSQSPVYQSPNPHTPSQAPYVYTQTIPSPQQSPSTNQTSDTPSLKDFYESQNGDLFLK